MRFNKVLHPGFIVESRKGHDAGRIYLVILVENQFCFLADGVYRKLDKLKKKRKTHVRFLSEGDLPDKLTDVKIKRIIKEWRMYGQRR